MEGSMPTAEHGGGGGVTTGDSNPEQSRNDMSGGKNSGQGKADEMGRQPRSHIAIQEVGFDYETVLETEIDEGRSLREGGT